MRREDEWRLGLRDGELLIPPGGRIRDIDTEVMQAIKEAWDGLIEAC